jgi:Tol biopolymer transport system component
MRLIPVYRIAICALVVTAGGIVPRRSEAQYFGGNKVRYRAFDFAVLKTEHFDVYFYPIERSAATQAARLAERWYARLSRLLAHQLRSRQPLILYASHPDFEETNAIPGELGEGTGGVTEILKRRIVLPLGASLAETNHVIGHELVHAFQFDITGQGQSGVGFHVPTAARLPLWFIEGMAEYLSLGPVDAHTAMWLRDALARKALPAIKDLDDPKYFPYRYGQAFWAFLAGHYGDQVVGQVLTAAGRSGDVDQALRKVTGLTVDTLSSLWRKDIEAAYAPLQAETERAASSGRLLIGGAKQPGLNVAPALSPDGDQLAFFSARDLFSIDLYLADARTGEIRRRITRTAVDPHYQSLEFINSAGAWDTAGRRLAFGAVSAGVAELSVFDVARDRLEREIPLRGLGEIFNPTWSPDGRSIAFSALAGGFTDLFRYDLQEHRLERLTDDAYADLEPAWSPDGRTIAFVTDRFSTSLADLNPGHYQLALLNVATGQIRPIPAFADAKNIDPHWSPDGSALYFVSDHNGISNLYRLDLATGIPYQVTNLYTGASGITALSPALAVASRTGRIVVSVYEGSGYSLYSVDSTAARANGLVSASLGVVSPAVLPPRQRGPSELLAMLSAPDPGLPPDTTFPVVPYHAHLALDYVAQPTIAVGVDRFGTYVGGGTGLSFSDMLGDEAVTTAFQISGSLKDLAALLAYENSRRRWTWGVAGEQVPYLTGGFGEYADTLRGDTVLFQQVFRFRQTNRDLSLLAAYPFSRVRRVELTGGFTSISFNEELETAAISLRNNPGFIYFDTTATLPAPAAITLGTAGAALVYDNSYFGATSPILGQRYRVEADPTVGSIAFVNVLVDYRRYVIPWRPFTLAARVIHFARYGSGGEDPRLAPLFLGYPSLVRGYDQGSFSTAECPTNVALGCPAFDRLLGSRLLVANVELRFPLLGVLGLGSGYYGAFPIEMAVFGDGGLAWNDREQTSLLHVRRQAVTSSGVALRVNFFGAAIGELDYVHPFNRPEKGSYFEFSLTQGF